jgi:hypothetical protein
MTHRETLPRTSHPNPCTGSGCARLARSRIRLNKPSCQHVRGTSAKAPALSVPSATRPPQRIMARGRMADGGPRSRAGVRYYCRSEQFRF